MDESLRSSLETKISETKAVKITAPTMAETVKEIDTQTTEMNTTDYSDALKSLNEAYTALNNSVKQYELVNNPAESYVIKCLEKVRSFALEATISTWHLRSEKKVLFILMHL